MSTLDAAARQEMKRELHAAGLRATAARLSVFSALRLLGRAVSHGELADHLEPEGLDRVTVYRNLIALTEAGLVSRFDAGDHVWRFAVASLTDDATSRFVCTECGAVEALPQVSLSVRRGPVPRAVQDRAVFVQLSGRCDDCE